VSHFAGAVIALSKWETCPGRAIAALPDWKTCFPRALTTLRNWKTCFRGALAALPEWEGGVSVHSASGRSSGNKITSRIDCRSVITIASRSMPIPLPAAGGMACSRART